MIKFSSSTVKNKLLPHKNNFQEAEPLVVSPIIGGMVTSIPAIDIQNHETTELKNFVVRFARTQRREGTTTFPAVKPNSNKILGLFAYDKSDGSSRIIRHTSGSIHSGSAASWTNLTGPVLTGSDFDRISMAILEDRYFFANGVNTIHEVNTTTNTYADLGNSPEYKYLVGFGDRLVGLNLGGLSPNFAQVGWSGDINYGEWNSLVDPTAGATILTSSGSDLSDPISGGVSFSNTMQIFRERSIWEATLTNSYSNPFYFYQKLPGIGCDCPYSIVKRPNGVCFVDFRTKAVYAYFVDGSIEIISKQIDKTFLPNITDKDNVVGAYNNTYDEYSVLIIDNLSTVAKVWTYSFRTQQWWYNEWNNVFYITNLDYLTGSITIDDLVGTIDNLVGTINDLSPTTKGDTFFLGSSAGDVYYTDSTKSTDADTAYPNYESVRASKEFELPVEANYVTEVVLEFLPTKGVAGSFVLAYQKDGGSWITLKTVTWLSTDQKNTLLRFKKNIRSRRFAFRVVSSSGLFDLLKFRINIDRAGENKK